MASSARVRRTTAHDGVHKHGRAHFGVAPEVHVDHDSSLGLQLRHQIGAQKGGFAGAPQAGEEQAGAQRLIEHPWMQQAAGQLGGQLGAAEHLGHDLGRSRTER